MRKARAAEWALPLVALVGGAVLAGVGFTGSYTALRKLGEAHGLGWFAPIFPIGLDAGIVVLLALDLWMIKRDAPLPILRFAAHGFTVATIVFNAMSGKESPAEDPVGAGMHAVMPLMFVMSVEAARHAYMKAAALAAGRPTGSVPLARWALSPARSWGLYRRMRLWGLTSYEEAVALEQERTVYRAMLAEKYGRGWRRKANSTALLPITMARYGLTVQEALDLPAEQRRREVEQQHKQKLADIAEKALEKKRAAELEQAEIRTQGEIQRTRYEVEGETGAAQAESVAAREAAQAKAAAAAREARREADAEQSQEAAEAERRAAEADQLAAEARLRTAEAAEKAERKENEAKRLAEDTKARAKRTAEAEADAAEARGRAAEARRRAAEAEARAAEYEDWAGLNPTDRKTRRVARVLLAAEAAGREVTNAELAAAIGSTSEGTGSTYRAKAVALIAEGYDPTNGIDPANIHRLTASQDH